MTADVAGFVAAAEAHNLDDGRGVAWLLLVTAPKTGCRHEPQCPAADRPDHDAAKVIAEHHDQGWVLLCGGIVVYDDTGETLPDGTFIEPHRPEPLHRSDTP